MKKLILINRQGETEFTLPLSMFVYGAGAWLTYAGRRWGFGVALLDGSLFYYETVSA